MKKKNTPQKPPSVSKEEVQHQFPKTEAILLRLTVQDKKNITDAAKSFHLTTTEYLVKCHAVISAKLYKSS